MRTVVVVDSEFGNTNELAEAMVDEFHAAGSVDIINVRAPENELQGTANIDLFVAGGPTQMHGVSRPLAEYLDRMPPRTLFAVPSASFDTRLRGWPLLTGAASSGIRRRLEKLGASMVVPAESFLVQARQGPLVEGEVERARAWAKQLVLTLSPQVASVKTA